MLLGCRADWASLQAFVLGLVEYCSSAFMLHLRNTSFGLQILPEQSSHAHCIVLIFLLQKQNKLGIHQFSWGKQKPCSWVSSFSGVVLSGAWRHVKSQFARQVRFRVLLRFLAVRLNLYWCVHRLTATNCNLTCEEISKIAPMCHISMNVFAQTVSLTDESLNTSILWKAVEWGNVHC